jgi:hypothetical protein
VRALIVLFHLVSEKSARVLGFGFCSHVIASVFFFGRKYVCFELGVTLQFLKCLLFFSSFVLFIFLIRDDPILNFFF